LEKIMRTAAVKPVTAADEDAAIDVVVRAFRADPAARWLYPDSNQYSVNFPNFVKVFGGKAFEHGSAYTIDDYAGAALWLPPEVHPDEEALAGLIQRSVPEHKLQEVLGVFEQMGSYHPSEPHWYLPLIGVDSAQQGRGYGSALWSTRLSGAIAIRSLPISNPRTRRI
jgi:ribosomal protein S18 acetylase RimI-like enzyme